MHLPPALAAYLPTLIRLASTHGWRVYVVGGFVRDTLLGLPSDDFDLIVEGDAPTLARRMAHALGGAVVTHAPFGTATWQTPSGAEIDFATARTETYPQPAALPQVTPADIQADLQRRDFTINALALPLTEDQSAALLDPFNGQRDLAEGVIRVLHPLSFQDDPTRILRAVRYEQRLSFRLAPETLALIPAAWEAFAQLTPDRIRHEFEIIFREARAAPILARLAELEILAHSHPALRWTERATEHAALLARLPLDEWRPSTPPPPDVFFYGLMLMAASPAEALEALTHLNVKRAFTEAVQEALALKLNGARPSEYVAQLDGLSEWGVMLAYGLYPAWRDTLHSYLAHWRFVKARLTGADLIQRGLKPGPHFKTILWQLRAARLDGEAETEQKVLEGIGRVA